MSFFDMFQEMLVILFAIGAGYLAHKLGFMDRENDQKISAMMFHVVMPVMILSSMVNADALPEAGVIFSILGVSAVFYLVEAVFVLVVPRLLGGSDKEKGVLRYTLAFPNIGYIGYPVAVAQYGAQGLFYAVILSLPFNLLSFTLGPLMLAGERRFNWRRLLNPCIAASIVGLAIVLLRWEPPALVGECLEMVAQITIPLSLMIVGSTLASLSGRDVLVPKLWILAAVRLLAMPAALAPVLRLLGTDPVVLGVTVTQMAMPVATSGVILCSECDGDVTSMARTTFVTTMASIVTIPLVVALLL